MGAGLTRAFAHCRGRGCADMLNYIGVCQDPVDVHLHRSDGAKSPLNRERQPGAKEVEYTAVIEQSGPAILYLIGR